MKKLTLSLLIAAVAVPASFAGVQVVTTDYKQQQPVVLPPPCFRDQEVQIDLFYSYNYARKRDNHYYRSGSGGGVGVNYFFYRYFGVSFEGNWWEGIEGRETANYKKGRNWKYSGKRKEWFSGKAEHSVAHQVTGNLILRYPVELSNFCFAPYIFGGGGGIFNGSGIGFGDAGAGLEWRATENFGIFADWRYNWTKKDYNDFHSTRAGVRFAF